MEIKIENPERSINVINTLLLQKYPEKLESGLHTWLNEIKMQIVEQERTERYRDTWRRIEAFPQYEINGLGDIRHRIDEDLVVVPFTGADGNLYVRLTKSRGVHLLNIQSLIDITFPEIKA